MWLKMRMPNQIMISFLYEDLNMDSMIDLLVLGVSGIIAPSQLPPFHHATHAAHHVGQHVCIAFYAHLPCRHAELQRSAPTSTRGVASTESRPFQPFRWWKWAYSLPKMIAPQAPQRITCHGGILHVSFTSYTHKSPHFHHNPLLAINPKGKTTLKEPQRIPPWVLPTLNGIAQKNNVAAQLLQTHLLAGENTETWPFSLNSNGLFLLPCRICRELSETPCPSNTCCYMYSNIMFKDKSNLPQATQSPQTFEERKKNTANISDSESYNALVCRALRTGQVEKSLVADIR